MLPLLEKEFSFWLKHRMQGFSDPKTNQTLFHYFQYKVKTKIPRPESYREDKEMSEGLNASKVFEYHQNYNRSHISRQGAVLFKHCFCKLSNHLSSNICLTGCRDWLGFFNKMVCPGRFRKTRHAYN